MRTDPFLDFFADPASWTVFASGLATGSVAGETGPDGEPVLRLDYDFKGGGGFVVLRKELVLALPDTFEINLRVRGEGPANHIEFKVVDRGNTNAWRSVTDGLARTDGWTGLRVRERDLPFAWGPAGGGVPGVIAAIELVVTAGPGDRGSVAFSGISLDEDTLHEPQVVRASSHHAVYPPEAVFEAAMPGGWRADRLDAAPWWSVDYGRPLRFGGLVIHWPHQVKPRRYEIQISDDGENWTSVHRGSGALGPRSHVPLPDAEGRFLRVDFDDADSAAMTGLELKPDAFSHTPNEFIHAVAADAPRGWFPRYWHREQSYWTPVGSPEGGRRALINEEGVLETDEAAFSLEPFLLVADRLVTWDDVEITLGMAEDGMPFPKVSWEFEGIRLRVLPWVDGSGETLALRATYQVDNRSGHAARLAVAVRPYQVNPPWQAFRNLGGRSTIRKVVCGEKQVEVDARKVHADKRPDKAGAAVFEEGGVVSFLSRGAIPVRDKVEDPSGLASAAMVWTVPELGVYEVTLTVPFFSGSAVPGAGGRAAALERWRELLGAVEWQVPPAAEDAVACFRTAAAHIMINRDGAAIQPGPRRYTRSWVRDCVIMGEAMAMAGQHHVLRDFLLWYAKFQREDGHVPSVVDRDGVDDLVEHDSHGQFIWGVREVFRDLEDMDFLQTIWQNVRLAAEHLIHLRSLRMTAKYLTPECADRYGLLPESASHEGYLSHPVHSYWDDFWGIRGLQAAAELAESMDLCELAAAWQTEARHFLADVRRSIDRVIAERDLKYIPGSVEWADFDPTATANAIAQLDFADDLPAGPLETMLETYLDGFRRKHRGEVPWLNYTAYEIRIIGAFVRMGKRDEAHELMDFFLSDRRPLEWNQWPEISWRDPHSPGHLGDVPHTWIAAEYMIALASMVASERVASGTVVLAAGMPWEWICSGGGFSVRGLAIRSGRLDFRIECRGKSRITFEIGGTFPMPRGGLSVAPPMPAGTRILEASDAAGNPLVIAADCGSVTVSALPVSATLILGASPNKI